MADLPRESLVPGKPCGNTIASMLSMGPGLPLAMVLTGGQRHDGPILIEVLDEIRCLGSAQGAQGHGSMRWWAFGLF